jgi:hypothetical protein
MSTATATVRRASPKQVEAYIPKVGEIVGNYELNQELTHRRRHLKPREETNLLAIGDPATGKSVNLVAHVLEILGDPDILYGYQTDFDFMSADGPIRKYVRLDGASIPRAHLDSLVQMCIDPQRPGDHTFVLLDAADEAFDRGLDGSLSLMLDHPQVTTYATMRTCRLRQLASSDRETAERLRGFLAKFRVRKRTENPEPEELEEFLIRRMTSWGIDWDSPKTVRDLIRKSGQVVGFALGALVEALGTAEGRLTFDLVSRYDPDPLNL